MNIAEYKHVALGRIFLKYISDAFQELYDDLALRQETEYTDPENRDEYADGECFLSAERGAMVIYSSDRKAS